MPKPMSVIDRARARLKKLNEKNAGSGSGSSIIKLEVGTTTVRIYRTWREEEDSEFYLELPYHKFIGPNGKNIKCRAAIGKRCPVCEEVAKIVEEAKLLKRKNAEANKVKIDKLFKKSSAMKAKPTFVLQANVITADGPVDTEGNPAEKPDLLMIGPMAMNGILSVVVDDEADIGGGKFWEDDTRYDFRITKSGKKLETDYVVKATVKMNEVDTSEIEKNLQNLDELFSEYPSYEEAKAMMEGTEVPESEAGDDEGSEEEPETDLADGEEQDDEDEEVEKASKKPAKKHVEEEEEDGPDEAEEEAEEAEEGGPDGAEDEEEEPAPKRKPVKAKASDEDEEVEVEEVEEEEEEKPAKKPSKKPVKDEEDEPEEAEDIDDSKLQKKPNKKVVDDDEPEDAEEDEKPVCFGDASDYDPKDKTCKSCPHNAACVAAIKAKAKKGAAVEAKLEKVAKRK